MHYLDQSRNVCDLRNKWTDWNAIEVNTAKEQFAEGFPCRQNFASGNFTFCSNCATFGLHPQ